MCVFTRLFLIVSMFYLVAAQRRFGFPPSNSNSLRDSSSSKEDVRARIWSAEPMPFAQENNFGFNRFNAGSQGRTRESFGDDRSGRRAFANERNENRPERGQRLCELKYAEYISRIFPNDDDTKADASESDFDGRELAAPGEYPHMTALGFETAGKAIEYKCGGSLISENFVITAAHCTNFTGAVPTKVRIGDLNLTVDEHYLAPQIRRVTRIYSHPQYESNSNYNDIALLQLNESISFTEFVRPIRLWTSSHIPFKTAYAMGYGATSFGRAPTNRLTDFNMTIISNEDCNKQLPSMPETPRGILENQICARDFHMNRDTCQGDSGGPLQLNIRGRRRRHRKHYHLVGITSFGFFCRSSYPSVYTRVSSFLDWIESIVWVV